MPLRGLTFSEAALAGLERIEPKKTRKQIVDKINSLMAEPLQKGATKLRGATNGLQPIFRIRSGNYRVIYSLKDETHVVVLDIGHRKDVYRNR